MINFTIKEKMVNVSRAEKTLPEGGGHGTIELLII